jgi:hypothetical protein
MLHQYKYLQGRHGRFLAGKAALVALLLPPPFFISQNPAMAQALAALPLVAVL